MGLGVGSNKMKAKNITGFFDCRKYQKGVVRQQRAMVAPGERINFSVGFETLEAVPEEMREFATKSEKSGFYYVSVKIFPKNCKVYTPSAKIVAFPELEKIDGGKFEINLEASIKHGTGTELNGIYANAIQVLRRADNPFDAEDGDDAIFEERQPVAIKEAPAVAPTGGSDLPF